MQNGISFKMFKTISRVDTRHFIYAWLFHFVSTSLGEDTQSVIADLEVVEHRLRGHNTFPCQLKCFLVFILLILC